MIQYTILCVGKLKEKFFSDAVREYEKRLSRYARLCIREVPDEKTPDRASEAEEKRIREREAERLLKHLDKSGPDGGTSLVIALDVAGQAYDSVEFAGFLSDQMIEGKSHIIFIIGGSLGLHESVLKRADKRISFSRMTFPHQLMRVILLEQIYRACRIQNNEPYHK